MIAAAYFDNTLMPTISMGKILRLFNVETPVHPDEAKKRPIAICDVYERGGQLRWGARGYLIPTLDNQKMLLIDFGDVECGSSKADVYLINRNPDEFKETELKPRKIFGKGAPCSPKIFFDLFDSLKTPATGADLEWALRDRVKPRSPAELKIA